MVKIGFASMNGGGLEDVIADRFGRAPVFTIVELDEQGNILNVKVVENPGASASSGAGVKSVQVLVDEGVDIAVGPNFGPNAQVILEEMNIKAVRIPAGTKIADALEKVKKEVLGL